MVVEKLPMFGDLAFPGDLSIVVLTLPPAEDSEEKPRVDIQIGQLSALKIDKHEMNLIARLVEQEDGTLRVIESHSTSISPYKLSGNKPQKLNPEDPVFQSILREDKRIRENYAALFPTK
jgi:hypothetical protein